MKVLSSRWSSQLDSFSFFPPSIVFKWEQDCLRIAGNPKPQVLRWVGVDVPCDCNHIVRILAPSTHTSCYTAAISLTLPHIHHAILLHILLHFRAYSMLRCCTFPCISTYIYILHATLLHFLLHFRNIGSSFRCLSTVSHIFPHGIAHHQAAEFWNSIGKDDEEAASSSVHLN